MYTSYTKYAIKITIFSVSVQDRPPGIEFYLFPGEGAGLGDAEVSLVQKGEKSPVPTIPAGFQEGLHLLGVGGSGMHL